MRTFLFNIYKSIKQLVFNGGRKDYIGKDVPLLMENLEPGTQAKWHELGLEGQEYFFMKQIKERG